MKVLVVEDDDLVATTLKHVLSSQNYAVDTAADGQAGLDMAEAFEYDLILLDIQLPKLDGIALCQKLREKGYRMPILLLTGLSDVNEKARGLNVGADDYVVKPFNVGELLARIQALLRRGEVTTSPILKWGNLQLDPSCHRVAYGSHPISLTAKEYALLELFLRNNQRIFSPGAILEHLWTTEEPPGEETVRSHIKTLRRKLQASGAPSTLIETVFGSGYRLNPHFSRAVEQTLNLPESLETPPLEAQTEKKYEKVLVVAGDRNLLAFLKELLVPQDLQVSTLEDARQLYQTLEESPVDLLVLDVDQNPSSGIELCQSLRQAASKERLPVILLIPNMQTTLVEQVFAAGADDFVSKPIAGPEFVSRVAGMIARFKRRGREAGKSPGKSYLERGGSFT